VGYQRDDGGEQQQGREGGRSHKVWALLKRWGNGDAVP
jgi:hypothetical protein